VTTLPPLVVPGQVSSLAAIADYVTATAMEAGLDQRAHYHLRLAVDELATNIVLHGYQEHGAQGSITLLARFDEQRVTMAIEDTAPAFDPRPALAAGATREPLEERDVGGLGLLLVSRSVDVFSYERVSGRNRNVVEIRRAHAAEAPARVPALVIAAGAAWHEHLAAAVDGLASIAWSGDVDELLAQIERDRPALILLGLELGGVAADACLRRLHARHGEALPPVVLLFEAGAEERAEACLDERVFDILSLHLPEALTRARLGRMLERVRREAELRGLRQRQAELETLQHEFTGVILPLGALLGKEPDLERLMERIVVEAMGICRADGGTLYLEGPGDELRFSIMRTESLGLVLGGATGSPVPYAPLPLHDPGTGMPNHRSAATSAANARRSINVPDVYDARAGFDFSGAKELDRTLGYRTVSCLTVPLIAGGSVLGVLQMINAQDRVSGAVIPFGAHQQQVIESLASQAAIALQNQRLLHEREHQRERERELQIGHEIQSSFLPATLPVIPGWELAAHMEPARLVSGDFYDAFELAPGCFGLIIADVCDKGVGAALFMGLIRSLLRAFAQTSWRPGGDEATARRRARQARRTREQRVDWLGRTLQRSVLLTNDYIAHTHGELDMFATLFFGVLEPESGLLLYSNCGHPPVLIVGPEGVRARLGPTAPALGVIPGADVRLARAVIAPGELCFGYTDGVLDARDRASERFGSERIPDVLARASGSAQGAIDALVTALRRHTHGAELFDDVSMLSVLRAR
jgi:sigma-B regulation protein RsbU (phosphoserine phosphatase)